MGVWREWIGDGDEAVFHRARARNRLSQETRTGHIAPETAGSELLHYRTNFEGEGEGEGEHEHEHEHEHEGEHGNGNENGNENENGHEHEGEGGLKKHEGEGWGVRTGFVDKLCALRFLSGGMSDVSVVGRREQFSAWASAIVAGRV